MPHKPTLTPTNNVAVWTAHEVRIIEGAGEDGRRYEELHAYLRNWLLDRMTPRKGASAITGVAFIEKTKAYPFIDQLLSREREEIFLLVDGFLAAHSDFKSTQLNVLTGPNPSTAEIITAGKKHLPAAIAFQQSYLTYLHSAGLGAEPKK
jgi:hypothetical protein